MVNLETARAVTEAAQRKAQEFGQPMNIAVVDAGGNLVSHVRMDGAWLGSIDISINKAFTARVRHGGQGPRESPRAGARCSASTRPTMGGSSSLPAAYRFRTATKSSAVNSARCPRDAVHVRGGREETRRDETLRPLR